MMTKKIELNCEEISDIEDLKYLIEEIIINFKDKNEEDIKKMINDSKIYSFNVYLLFSRIFELLPLINNILNKYYENDEINIKLKSQRKMCDEHNIPHFAPDNGFCFNCNKQIYKQISLRKASEEHITHCPYCSRAYND